MLKILLILILLLPLQLKAQVSIIALDVKEGQSILIKHQNTGMLIDVGHAGQSTNVLNKLRQYGIEKVESIILTHLHPDHAGGYFRLKEAFPSAKIYSNCQPISASKQPDSIRWINEALQVDTDHHCLKADDRLLFKDVELTVLSPATFTSDYLNPHSLVINISYKNTNVLAMGDAGFTVEEKLIHDKKLPTKLSALIVGHHGANDATSVKFLRTVNPDIAVISVNKNNIRGYPAPTTIDRLEALNIKVKRTDLFGDIKIY